MADSVEDRKSKNALINEPNRDDVIGMNETLRKKFYCMTTFSEWEKCTKHTNPNCACGKIIFNRIKIRK
jgi:hypothetical protein